MGYYNFTKDQKKKIKDKIINFYNLVLYHSNGEFISFRKNEFLDYYEGYKYKAIKDTEPLIKKIQERQDYGNGNILGILKDEAIPAGKNLVNSFWRNNIQKQLTDLKGEKRKIFEKKLHDFYSGRITAKNFFVYYTETIGKIYSIVAYILFIKDCNNYLPIATETFDLFFEEIGLDFHTKQNCSWENYCEYNSILKEIRMMLEEEFGLKTKPTLIDAHSFVWVCEDTTHNEWRKNHKEECAVEKKYTKTVIQARQGQGKFRDAVRLKWHDTCSVSDFAIPELMTAAHIKPFSECTEKECLDPENGLLLTPNLNALFDWGKGYISFDNNGKIIISKRLTPSAQKDLGINNRIKLKKVTTEMKKYLLYHRENVFK